MKKIIKKVIKETLEDKRLQMAYVYFSNYMDSLEEVVVVEYGDIYLRESGDRYAKVWIRDNVLQCWVNYNFWKEFSDKFSLEGHEVESLITYWVEKTYQLKYVITLPYYVDVNIIVQYA